MEERKRGEVEGGGRGVKEGEREDSLIIIHYSNHN